MSTETERRLQDLLAARARLVETELDPGQLRAQVRQPAGSTHRRTVVQSLAAALVVGAIALLPQALSHPGHRGRPDIAPPGGPSPAATRPAPASTPTSTPPTTSTTPAPSASPSTAHVRTAPPAVGPTTGRTRAHTPSRTRAASAPVLGRPSESSVPSPPSTPRASTSRTSATPHAAIPKATRGNG